MKKIILLAFVAALGFILTACGGNDKQANADESKEITIGYFPNINHVAGMVAEEKKLYAKTLPDGTTINYKYFPDGSAFMTAIETGEIAGGLVGPGPAMNHFTSGAKINIVAAGSTGGTVIMARKGSGIESPEDLKGHSFISPHVGCTHNVQFETMMKEKYNITSKRIGGTMKHVTGKPATYHRLFKTGKVDAATVPEPWASVIEKKGSGKVLVDTKNVAYGKTLPAAVFVTSQDLVNNKPKMVQNIVDAHKKTIKFIQDNPDKAKKIAIKKIKEITDQKLSRSVIDNAWKRINFTYKIDGEVLQDFANSSYQLEFLPKKPNLDGLVDKSFIQ